MANLPLIMSNQPTQAKPTTRSIAAVPANVLADVQKYAELAAQAAIATQQVAASAPGATKLQTALNFVNVGLGVAATAAPALAPILALASGLESPFAGLITGFVQLFKAHGLHGFVPNTALPPIPVAATASIVAPMMPPVDAAAEAKKDKIAAARKAVADAQQALAEAQNS